MGFVKNIEMNSRSTRPNLAAVFNPRMNGRFLNMHEGYRRDFFSGTTKCPKFPSSYLFDVAAPLQSVKMSGQERSVLLLLESSVGHAVVGTKAYLCWLLYSSFID